MAPMPLAIRRNAPAIVGRARARCAGSVWPAHRLAGVAGPAPLDGGVRLHAVALLRSSGTEKPDRLGERRLGAARIAPISGPLFVVSRLLPDGGQPSGRGGRSFGHRRPRPAGPFGRRRYRKRIFEECRGCPGDGVRPLQVIFRRDGNIDTTGCLHGSPSPGRTARWSHRRSAN